MHGGFTLLNRGAILLSNEVLTDVLREVLPG